MFESNRYTSPCFRYIYCNIRGVALRGFRKKNQSIRFEGKALDQYYYKSSEANRTNRYLPIQTHSAPRVADHDILVYDQYMIIVSISIWML